MKIFKKILNKIFNYKYILNVKTGEVHLIKNVGLNCGVDKMANKNKKYITEKKYNSFLTHKLRFNNKEVNGCIHCNKINNTD